MMKFSRRCKKNPPQEGFNIKSFAVLGEQIFHLKKRYKTTRQKKPMEFLRSFRDAG